jgi:hypothetical protein
MFARFFSTTEIDALADAIVGELCRLMPVGAAATDSKSAARAREQTEAKVRKRVNAFAASTPLNVYQKAKLGTRLEAALSAAGYPAEFSKSFSYDVVRTLAIAAAARKP